MSYYVDKTIFLFNFVPFDQSIDTTQWNGFLDIRQTIIYV